MAYTPNLPAAARRHLLAADILFNEGNRPDVAGYLYGISAECAIKAMMIEAGMRPKEIRKEDPFYAHFPQLKTMLRDNQFGRNGAILNRFIHDDNFFSQWNTDMRYSHGNEINQKWIDSWKSQAKYVVDCIGT